MLPPPRLSFLPRLTVYPKSFYSLLQVLIFAEVYILAGIAWEKGYYKQTQNNSINRLIYVNGIENPEPKLLNEAKGIITADYQNYLEKEWIKELRKKYTVEINQEVLNSIEDNSKN